MNEKTIDDVRRELRAALTAKYGEGEASAMADIIIMHLKGWSRAQMLADGNREASDYIKNRSAEILRDLLRDRPLQYILGETAFYGLKLKVGEGVLIPRPETEELVDLIVKANRRADLRVLDICTGSGAIALALARNLPFAKVEAIDISPKAIEYARENAQNLKVRLTLEQADVFSLSLPQGAYDIIVSNPPYVGESEKNGMEPNVIDYEPHEALFVPDADPLRFYRRIAEISRDALRPGGMLYFEINPLHEVELAGMLKSLGYSDVEVLKDIHEKPRFAIAQKPDRQ